MKYKRLFLRLNDQQLIDCIRRYHFENQETLIQTLYRQLIRRIEPVVYYEYNYPSDGQMTVTISLGDWPDTAMEQFQAEGNYSKAYAVECLCLQILSHSYEQLKEIVHRETRGFLTDMIFCDEKELSFLIPTLQTRWPDFPVMITDSFALLPSKTVVFYGICKDVPSDCSHTCDRCTNTDCCFRNLYL